MTTPPRLLLDPVPTTPTTDSAKGVVEGFASITLLVGAAHLAVYRWMEEAVRKAQEEHLRGERRAAYRVRHRWKASDVQPLLSIGINEIAQPRVGRLKGKGRPVVRPHRPLERVLCDKLASWSNLFRDDATASERRRSVKVWPWWKHYVEALYRGEVEQARASKVKGPQDHAERAIAATLRMSQGMVHAICGEIRAIRLEDAEAANFPPMVLAEFEQWMEYGELPKRLTEE